MLTCDDVTPYAQLPHQSASRPASSIIIIIIIIIIYETRAVAQISVHANVYIGQHTRVCEPLTND